MAKFTEQAVKILEARYLLKDKDGNVVEKPDEMLDRVAKCISKNEKNAERWEKKFLDIMDSLEFLPNSPTLMNSGRNMGLSGCYVLSVEDDLAAIFEAVKQTALIHKSSGGTGFSFTKIRPNGSIVNTTRGTASGPVSFMEVFNAGTSAVKQGGGRRGANLGTLSISHPDILEFINCKKDTTKLTNFNISVGMTGKFLELVKNGRRHWLINPHNHEDKKSIDANDLFTIMCNNIWENGEPGILFLDTINDKNPIPWMGKILTTNPCITGDTLIAVADGRNAVSIKQLADEGKDVPVYCRNTKGKVSVRMMRNPRITGTKEIYKVMLDNDKFIKVTGNHKVVLSDGSVKQAKDLFVGDSLNMLTRRLARYSTIVKHSNSVSQHYSWFKTSNSNTYQLEHRLITNFYNPGLGYKKVVHHKDRNGLNNAITNLEIMTKEEHDKLHSIDMMGDKNPMRRFPRKNCFNDPEWQLKMRIKHHIGAKRKEETKRKIGDATISHFKDKDIREKHSKATKEGMHKSWSKFEDFLSKRALNKLQDCQSKTDLECFIIGNSVFVKKYCEKCGTEFVKSWSAREICYCSVSCWNSKLNTSEFRKQLKVYNNHLVVSIEKCDKEVVYNGTVDEHHNYYIGHFEEEIEGDKCFTYVNTLQCGEVPLLSAESCNLGSIDVSKFVNVKGEINWEKLVKTVEIATRFLDNIIDVNVFPNVKIARKTRSTRKIGLGIMGWADMLLMMKIRYDSEEALELATKLMSLINQTAHETSEELGKEKGYFPANNGILKRRNATLTTIAPTGTLSMLADCSSGIEPVFAKKFTKTVLGNVTLDISKKYQKLEGDYFVTALEISPEWHVRMQAAFQKNVDNAVSKTINLPHEATLQNIKKAIYLAHELGCKGLTMYRQGTREAPIQITSEGLSECEGDKCQI